MITRMLRRMLSNLLSWVIFALALVTMAFVAVTGGLVALRALIDMDDSDG